MQPPDTQICLLSEQPTPNLSPLMDNRLKPRALCLVVTPQQEHRVPAYREVLGPRGITVSTLSIPDAFNTDMIISLLEKEIEERRARGERLHINATGGTKPMSIAAYIAGFNADVPVLYVHDDCVDWLVKGHDGLQSLVLENRLKLEPFLRIHGVRLRMKQVQRSGPEMVEFAKRLVNLPSFSKAVSKLNGVAGECAENNILNYTMSQEDIKNQPFQSILDELAVIGKIRVKGLELAFTDETTRNWCNGLWLEDLVASTLQSMKSEQALRIHDLQFNVEVDYIGADSVLPPVSGPENELDAVFLANNLLHVVECKTRNFKKVEATEALYKLATLRRQLGGSQARAILVSHFALREKDRERAKILGVELCSGGDLRLLGEKLRTWVGNTRG